MLAGGTLLTTAPVQILGGFGIICTTLHLQVSFNEKESVTIQRE